MWEIAYLSDKGIVRNKNDDRVMVNHKVVSSGTFCETLEDRSLVVICDGVGGEQFGDEAAEIVAEAFGNLNAEMLNAGNIQKTIDGINALIVNAQQKDIEHRNMATTVAGLVINDNDFFAFNVGDSRVYRYVKPYIVQLSEDHSLARELYLSGIKVNDAQKHIVTRCFGGESFAASVFDGTGTLGNEELFIICTDGVWDVVSDIEIEMILSQPISAKIMSEQIYDFAIKNNSHDNISLAVIRRI